MKKLTLITIFMAIFASSSVMASGELLPISVPAEGLSFYLIGLSAVVIGLVAAKLKNK